MKRNFQSKQTFNFFNLGTGNGVKLMPFFEDYDERSISFNFKAKLIERQYIISTNIEDITDFKSRQPRKGLFLNFYAAKIKENS
jgi:hypothetical protein